MFSRRNPQSVETLLLQITLNTLEQNKHKSICMISACFLIRKNVTKSSSNALNDQGPRRLIYRHGFGVIKEYINFFQDTLNIRNFKWSDH